MNHHTHDANIAYMKLHIATFVLLLFLLINFMTNDNIEVAITPIKVNIKELAGSENTLILRNPNVIFGRYPKDPVSVKSLVKDINYPKERNRIIIGEHAENQYKPGRIANSVNLLHFNDIYFLSDDVYVYNGSYVLFTRSCHPKYWEQFYQKKDIVEYKNIREFESVICLGHQHTSDFGHWFLEALPAYSAIPKDILLKSYVVVPEEKEYIYQGFEAIGVKRDHVIAGGDNLFFAKNFYTVEFTFCGDLVPFLVNNLRNHFVNLYNLDKVEPDLFLVYNRKGKSRAIGNFDELMKMLNTKFPKIKWQEAVLPNTLEEQAKYFNRVKLIFSIHGSIFANGLFMQNDTAIVDLQMEQWLLSFLYLTSYTGKYMVAGRDPAISWRGLTPNIINLNYVEKLIETALKEMNVTYN